MTCYLNNTSSHYKTVVFFEEHLDISGLSLILRRLSELVYLVGTGATRQEKFAFIYLFLKYHFLLWPLVKPHEVSSFH